MLKTEIKLMGRLSVASALQGPQSHLHRAGPHFCGKSSTGSQSVRAAVGGGGNWQPNTPNPAATPLIGRFISPERPDASRRPTRSRGPTIGAEILRDAGEFGANVEPGRTGNAAHVRLNGLTPSPHIGR